LFLFTFCIVLPENECESFKVEKVVHPRKLNLYLRGLIVKLLIKPKRRFISRRLFDTQVSKNYKNYRIYEYKSE